MKSQILDVIIMRSENPLLVFFVGSVDLIKNFTQNSCGDLTGLSNVILFVAPILFPYSDLTLVLSLSNC